MFLLDGENNILFTYLTPKGKKLTEEIFKYRNSEGVLRRNID